jgi:hypothetical protein
MENIKRKKIYVNFEFTPLGNVIVEWLVPKSLIQLGAPIEIEIPGFKYDLPTFASIPVPFSSKAIPLKLNLDFLSVQIKGQVRGGLYGNKYLVLIIEESRTEDEWISLKYEIENILNADGVYFVAVYPFRSPFDNIEHKISLKAKFSFNIRIYKFWERYFLYPTNKPIKRASRFVSKKEGDQVRIDGSIIPAKDFTLDLHLTGTRFPIFIRRDRFWMSIFIIIIIVFLSPYLVELFKFIF